MLEVRERLERAPGIEERAQAAVLRAGFDTRMKSRFVAALADGREVGVVLPRGTILRDGDLLVATSGEAIRVEAAPQPVLCITAGSPHDLMRIVYHLANRHVPARIAADYVLIEPDPVLAHLVEHLGGQVESALMPFDPEPGAYEGGSGEHRHAHGHAHGHPHADAPDPAAAGVGEQLSIEAHQARPAGRIR